jgi:hypothetical protein
MTIAVHACEKLLRSVQGSKSVIKSGKQEGDNHGQGRTTLFLWNVGVKPSDIQRRLSSVSGEKALCSGPPKLGSGPGSWAPLRIAGPRYFVPALLPAIRY